MSVDLIAVRGTIIDEATEAVLEGAKISAIGTPFATVSSNDGRYLIRGLANENQVIRASLDGYIPEAREL